jgi:hypothetical protein
VRFHNPLFVIWSGQKMLNIFLRHLLKKTCNLALILFEFFQVSQPYSRTAFKYVLQVRSLGCVEYAVEYQILFAPAFIYW